MRQILAAAALTLAATATPAAAHPELKPTDVRRHVTGVAEVHVLATNRAVYRVTTAVSAIYADSTKQYSWIEVRVAKCAKGTCATPVAYYAPLTSANYSVSDLKNVTVTLSAFGKPFVVNWAGAGPASDRDTTPNAAGGVAELNSEWAATAKVTVLGVTCSDPKGAAARRNTVYPTGFDEPKGMVPIPAKAPVGQPAAARSCRPGPA